MPHRRIKAILFDLGDTVLNFGKVSTTPLFLRGARLSYEYVRQRGQYGGAFWWYFLRNLVHLRYRHLLANLTGKDFDASALIRKVGTRKGFKLSEEQWAEYSWLWYEPLAGIATVEPTIHSTLETLQGLGCKLGVVSNTFVCRSSLARQLEQLGILQYFDQTLYSYEFKFRKPHPEIFRIAAERIGETPQNILFVGDRIDKDIIPALRVGMHAALKQAYTNRGKTAPAGTWKITEIAELPGLVEKINTGAALVSA